MKPYFITYMQSAVEYRVLFNLEKPLLDQKRVAPSVLDLIKKLCRVLEIEDTHTAGQIVTHTSLSSNKMILQI